ncbi:MAG: nucleotidyltransferase family protein [Terrimicrobiaceae bacterium]
MLCAVILAAGRSSRMGCEKSRLPWLGKMLLPWMVEELSLAGWEPRVVVGPESFEFWKTVLGGERVVLQPMPERGKATSLACGVKHLPAATRWILATAVDQPRLPAVYQRLREATSAHPDKTILVPGCGAGRGHPVVLAGSLRNEMLALAEDAGGLRGLLDARHGEIYRVTDANPTQCRWDFNTPDEYAEALDFFQRNISR